jgi:hypothetical protein
MVNTSINFIRKNRKYVYLEADMLEAEEKEMHEYETD